MNEFSRIRVMTLFLSFLQKNWIVTPLLLIVALVGLSFNTQVPFSGDDFQQIVNNQKIIAPTSIKDIIFNGNRQIRVWQNLSFALDWSRGRGDVRPFHQSNNLLHGLNAILFFWLCVVIFQRKSLALVGFCLFLLHPLMIPGHTYIMGRVSLFQGFYLLLLLLLLFRKKASPVWQIFAVLFLSLFAKESCALFPFIILFFDYFVKKKLRGAAEYALYFSVIPLIFLIYLLLKDPTGMYNNTVGLKLYPFWEHLVYQLSSFWFTLLLFINPMAQSSLHPYTGAQVSTVVGALFSFLFLIGLTVFILRKKQSRSLWMFFLVGFLFMYFQTNSIIQFINPYAEYRLYKSLPFLYFLILLGCSKTNLVNRIALGAILVLCSLAGHVYVLDLWKSPFRFAAHSLEIYPDNAQTNHEYGLALERQGHPHWALKYLLKAFKNQRNSKQFQAIYADSLIRVLTKSKRYDEALPIIKVLERFQDYHSENFYHSYLHILKVKGDWAGFERIFAKAKKHFPTVFKYISRETRFEKTLYLIEE